MAIRKLAIANLLMHKVRVGLTVAAIALSVSLVVSVTSGYASAEGAAEKFLSRFMGTADAMITHQGDPHAAVPESVVDELRKDNAVKRVTGRLELENGLIDAQGQPIIGHPAQVIGISRPEDNRVENLNLRSGEWFDSSTGNVAVIDQIAAQKLELSVGDSFTLPGVGTSLKLKVVGIVQKPMILAAHIQSIYLPLRTLQNFSTPGKPPQVNRVMIDLYPNANIDDFVTRWKPKLADIDPSMKLRLARDNRKELDKNLQGIHILSYLGGTVSMLAATFIVFSALSMGVSERSRTLAMMRAIGMERSQIARLVVAEGLLLAICGAAIGVPLGWFWIKLISIRFHELLSDGVVLSTGGVLYGALGSIGAALAASLLPAWSATRVRPLEAMTPLANPPSTRAPIIAAIVGLVLISLDPLVLFGPWEQLLTGHVIDPNQTAREIQFFGHFSIGLPSLMLGFFLLAPAFVWVLERLLGPFVARLMGLNTAVLRQQLSTGLWRTAGTCAALMVGLAILVAMETQGNSMLNGWKIPDKFPDIFIVSWGGGLNDQQIDQLKKTKGIKPGELMPIAIASPEFGSSIFALGAASVMPEATMFFGIDPEQGLRMMALEFREGNSADAIKMLKMGRHIIVTEEFRQLKHLGVGDKLPLKTARHGTVDYTIAAVVWSPGIDVITGMFDMGRQFDQRTAASIFGSLDDAKEDFGVDGIRLFAANLELATNKDQMLKDVQQQVGLSGLQAGDVRTIKHNIQTAFANLLLLISAVPFAAMGVSSLGVANTIMASIRTRRWQFGIFRSVGFTRAQLLRLVLSEALLVGIVGAALGLTAGCLLASDARELNRTITGYAPPVSIPWPIIGWGVVVVVGVSLLASLWPAINVARTEPLSLLQTGRASA